MARSVLLLFMSVDWLIQATVGYKSGPSISGFSTDSPLVLQTSYMIPYAHADTLALVWLVFNSTHTARVSAVFAAHV